MPEPSTCPGGDHRPPPAGGSCACGMVTRVPARPGGREVDVRTMVVRLIGDGAADPEGTADRLLAALAEAGVPVGPEAGLRQPA